MTLEELLNKLIQMGWKPRGNENCKINIFQDSLVSVTQKIPQIKVFRGSSVSEGTTTHIMFGSLRDLVSMESGLWQFVCEKDLYREIFKKIRATIKVGLKKEIWFNESEPEYRLMLSSIQKDIPKFLLDNILLPTK